jgi:hypothetical protein
VAEPAIPIVAGTTVNLVPGDRILLPAGTPFTWGNPGTVPATALETAIVDSTTGPGSPGAGIGSQALVGDVRPGAPLPARATVVLRRQTLAPGETVPPPAGQTLQGIGADDPRQAAALAVGGDGAATNAGTAPARVLVLTIDAAAAAATPAASPVE